MARARSPNRDKAFEMWKESNTEMLLKDIASELSVSDSQIRKWKNQDNWESQLKGNVTNRTKSNVTNKGGAPKGSKNALGNKGGSAPKRNKNAEKHGLFSKYLPEETMELVEHFEQEDQLSKIKRNIAIQEAAIIRAQKIMHVESKEELIKHLKKSVSNNFGDTEEWEFQYAWDRQATLLNSQSRAMGQLSSMIRQYEEMCRLGWADDEQKIRVEKLKSEVKLLEQKATQDVDKPIEILISRKGERS